MTKILLVEDDKSLREIYGVRLLAEGYDIVSAGDGEEALATAIKEKPDLIVSDVMMPKISGFDMLDILRSTPETKDIRVIMMTALSSEDQRDRGEKLGADRYLVKSQVGIEDVVRTVHEVLGDAPTATPQFSSIQQPQAQPAPQPEQQPQQQAQPEFQQPMPQPEMMQPVPQPEMQPQMQPAAPEVDQLPQPTAPFSSPRPATLGERVIQPLEQSQPVDPEASLADRISAELAGAAETPQPEMQPQMQPEMPQQHPVQPQVQPIQQPQMMQPEPQMQPDFQQPMPQPEMMQQPEMPQAQPMQQPQQFDQNPSDQAPRLNVPPRQ